MHRNSWIWVILLCFHNPSIFGAETAQGGHMQITSSAFQNNQMIPAQYTCEGHNNNPPLTITGVPSQAKSLALIVDDPDAPMGTWVHWVVFNIPAQSTMEIKEKQIPGIQGINNFGELNYGGPCPPSGTHHYFFKAYALDQELVLKQGAKKSEVEKAMKGHVLAEAQLIGLYKKRNP